MIYTSAQLQEMYQGWLEALALNRDPQSLYDPVKYVLSMGGKRLRPVLMLLAYNLFKDDVERVKPQALGIEIYHNFTLLHDDLMDKADVRRGHPTVHKRWNDNTAILSGDAMTVLAYQQIEQCDEKHLHKVINLFNQTAIEICEGQQYDMDFESRLDVTEAEYMEMIRLKTSVLLAASLKIGAILADASEKDADLLYDFGICLGLAFQLKDDLLDVYGDPKVFGKKNGGDILCNKKTFLLIKALELANESQLQGLNRWIEMKEFSAEEKINAVTTLYNIVGVKGITQKLIEDYSAKASALLNEVSVSEERKEALRKLMEGLKTREV
jgi:geranylgeranyl diphosphate synthase type II